MRISEFQAVIAATYGERDRERGLPTTFAWFVEEVGELSRALFREDAAEQRLEFSDAFAWLVSLASLAGVDLEDAVARYATGCPKCDAQPCACR